MKRLNQLIGKKGVAAVEFAIILPVLALLAFGLCEFGLIFYDTQVIINGSREGARAGIVRDGSFISVGAVKQVVKDYCNQRLIDFSGTTLTDGDIVLNPDTDALRMAADFGDNFSVEVTYNYNFLVPSLFGLGAQTPIKHITLMKMERIP